MKLLHITDLHIGTASTIAQEQENWERLYKEIAAHYPAGSFDLIAVTGDLVLHGTTEEFHRTADYLHRLTKQLGLTNKEIFFCCGNHDSDTPDACSTYHAYEEFLTYFYGSDPIPEQGAEIDDKYQIFTINTCKKTSLKRFNDCWFDPEDLAAIQKAALPDRKGILLMHHQPEIFQDQTAIDQLSPMVCCLLNGHLHTGYTRCYEWKNMISVNGLALTPHISFVPSGFQTVEFAEDGTIHAHMHAYTPATGYVNRKA